MADGMGVLVPGPPQDQQGGGSADDPLRTAGARGLRIDGEDTVDGLPQGIKGDRGSVHGSDEAGVVECGGGKDAGGGDGVEGEAGLGEHVAVVGEEVSVASLKELAVGDGHGELIEKDAAVIDDDIGINVGAGGEQDVVDVGRLARSSPAAQGQNQQQG